MLVFTFISAVGVISAQGQASVAGRSLRLAWQVEASGCPAQHEFEALVSARLGASPFASAATGTVTMSTTRVGERLLAALVIEGPTQTRPLRRDFEGSPRDCEELLTSAAVSLALYLDPPPVASGAGSQILDVVVLRDDRMVVGTLAERGETVRITAPDGREHRFARNEVIYAGPLGEEPPPVPAPPDEAVPVLPTVSVSLRSSEPGTVYFVRTGTATFFDEAGSFFRELCTAPCDVRVPPGQHRFSLRLHDDEGRIPVEPPVDIRGGEVLTANVFDAGPIRLFGWGLLLAAAVGGTAMMVVGRSEVENNGSSTLLVTGLSLFLGGGLVGVLLCGVGDGAELSVTSGSRR